MKPAWRSVKNLNRNLERIVAGGAPSQWQLLQELGFNKCVMCLKSLAHVKPRLRPGSDWLSPGSQYFGAVFAPHNEARAPTTLPGPPPVHPLTPGPALCQPTSAEMQSFIYFPEFQSLTLSQLWGGFFLFILILFLPNWNNKILIGSRNQKYIFLDQKVQLLFQMKEKGACVLKNYSCCQC